MAELGQHALAGLDLLGLVGAAADAARHELGTDYATVLELTSDRRSLLVRAAAGFPDDALGGVLRADAEELAGHALEGDGPVVIELIPARSARVQRIPARPRQSPRRPRALRSRVRSR